jgi:hypothetical protein
MKYRTYKSAPSKSDGAAGRGGHPRGGRGSPRSPRGGRGRGSPRGGRGHGHGASSPTSRSFAGDAPENAKDMLSIGLLLVGFHFSRQDVSHTLNVDRFRSFYGISPEAMLQMYRDLIEHSKENGINVSKFFMAMNWLRLYDTEHVLAARWHLDEQTIRNHVVLVVSEMQKVLKPLKVVWGGFEGFSFCRDFPLLATGKQ